MNDDPCRRFRVFIPFAVLAFVALLTLAVYALWNGVVTDVFGLKDITYWQALGLLVLSKILFGGFPGGRRCGGGPGGRRKRLMMEKHWASLDPAERQRLREEMRERFGDWPRPPWCAPDDDADEPPSGPRRTV